MGGPGSGRKPEGKSVNQNKSENIVMDPVKMMNTRLPKEFKKYGKNINSLPAKKFEEYKKWIKENWAKGN
jgi:hypothetical protein